MFRPPLWTTFSRSFEHLSPDESLHLAQFKLDILSQWISEAFFDEVPAVVHAKTEVPAVPSKNCLLFPPLYVGVGGGGWVGPKQFLIIFLFISSNLEQL